MEKIKFCNSNFCSKLGDCLSIFVLGIICVFIPAGPFALKTLNAAETDSFENSIRPLLTRHCIKCHGARKSESGLRLDSREAMLKGGDSGPAITLSEPDQSLILKALRHEDGLEMPPLEKRPEAETVAVLDWIRSGAKWPANLTLDSGKVKSGPAMRGGPIQAQELAHWAYQPLKESNPPPVHTDGRSLGPIDRFIEQKLVQAGLQPAPAASKRDWLRRATFDLTGLPPTLDEMQNFLADGSSAAYAKVVNRLLASPAYGERWGRHWLDVVRYADTAGETADYPTPLSYKYRNWVIDSFSSDKPYDEFVREQIAGDIMANQLSEKLAVSGLKPTGEQVKLYQDLMTATGFIAISRRFGFDVENYHHLTIQDTIDVVGQSMLGLTLGCARCHDHKYDPVNMTDYYAWYGIFQSTRYSFPGSEEKKRPYDLYPALPASVVAERQKQFDATLAELNNNLTKLDGAVKSAADELKKITGSADYFGFEQATIGKVPPKPYSSLGTAIISSSAQSPFQNVFAAGSRGISFPSDSENNAFGRTLPKSFKSDDTPVLHYNIDFRNTAVAQGGQGAYRFYVGHGPGNSGALEMAANATNFLVKQGSQYEAVTDLKMGEWYNVQVKLDLKARTYQGVITSFDSTTGSPSKSVTFEGKSFTTGWDGLIDYTFVDKYGPGSGPTPAHDVDNLCIDSEPFGQVKKLLNEPAKTGGLQKTLAERFAELQDLQQARDELSARINQIKQSGPVPAEDRIYGAIEQEKPADSRIQLRGDNTRPGEVAPRRNLEILGGEAVPNDSGSGRLQMAEWLTRDDNPLMARVMVNRIWQNHFGRGLVGTENDFGARGERPSHPELLDWLACRFRDSGYSVKAMHRLIMNTEVYRRSTEFQVNSADNDPESRLLWRFNRRRLSAEEIRDAMLAVSVNLDHSQGQAHPFPPVESWGFSQHSPFYGVYPSNRRSVYLMQQRLKRHPFLGLFDGADTNTSTAHRELTTVPTQALFLMNNDFVHEQASFLANSLVRSGSEEQAMIRSLFETCLCRPPDETEMKESTEFLAHYREAISPTDHPSADIQIKAWSALVRTLLTRNEFLFVD